MLASLVYVSRGTIPPSESEAALRDLVATSTSRNAANGITGALLFTGAHFAQVLEGEHDAVEALLAAVERDPRHENLRVVERWALAERRFTGWSMAYSGPSIFVSRHVRKLMAMEAQSVPQGRAEWLTDLLYEFTANQEEG